ncbi:MAG: hypothetical protein WBK91_06440 [Alphaproteobacteria bacterium]
MVEAYTEVGDIPVVPNMDAIKAGMSEKLSQETGGKTNTISNQFDLTASSKPVVVDVNGRNTEAVTVELKLPALTGEELEESAKMAPEVESKVDNVRLANMLEGSGHANRADDVRAINQALKLNDKTQPGGQEAHARLSQRMNLLHKQSAGIFGLNKPDGPALASVNDMKPAQIEALVATARQQNDGLKDKDLTKTASNGLPVAVNDLNKQQRQEKELAMRSNAGVERISIGIVGMNFSFDRKNTIEQDAAFVPKDRVEAQQVVDKRIEEKGAQLHHQDPQPRPGQRPTYAAQMGRDKFVLDNTALTAETPKPGGSHVQQQAAVKRTPAHAGVSTPGLFSA